MFDNKRIELAARGMKIIVTRNVRATDIVAYDLGNADYTEGTYKKDGKAKTYNYAKLPSEGMDSNQKKVDKWLRNNAGDYGFVLPLPMTNERHHWEYIGIENAGKLATYVDFDPPGNVAKPKKNESFSLRFKDNKKMYMKTEKD